MFDTNLSAFARQQGRRGGERDVSLGTRNVVIAAAFPPPLHGLSKISDSVASDLATLANVRRYDLSARSLARSPTYHVRRLLSVVLAAAGVLRNGLRPNAALYIPADGGLGLAYTLVLTALARISGQAIFVHHHSFSAIDQRQWLMNLLVQVAGEGARHVFLCASMERRFRAHYPGRWKGLVSSNAVHLAAVTRLPGDDREVLRLGLLSNLTRDKGLHLFLDMLRACVAHGVPVQGLLAGPVENNDDAAAIERAREEFGERLAYLGPLYGPDKDSFLSGLDVFVFPTSYRNEAQPNAVFEAMSAGAAVIVYARGCLGEDVSPECGLLVDPADDFLAAACAQIAAWSEDRAALRAARVASLQRFLVCKEQAARGYRDLLQAIAGRETPAA